MDVQGFLSLEWKRGSLIVLGLSMLRSWIFWVLCMIILGFVLLPNLGLNMRLFIDEVAIWALDLVPFEYSNKFQIHHVGCQFFFVQVKILAFDDTVAV